MKERTLNGTYVSVEPFHLFRYLDEQAFRFNNRKMTDGERYKVGRGIDKGQECHGAYDKELPHAICRTSELQRGALAVAML